MIRASKRWPCAQTAILAIVMALTAGLVSFTPQSAYADENDKDILLGMFPIAAEGGTNNIYASYDGETLYRIASVYESEEGQPYAGNHYPQACTSIIYHDGFFWSISAWNKHDGKFWPMISYSKDLIHWTHPEGSSFTGTRGVPVDDLPYVEDGKPIGAGEFDVVAPEWSIMSNGEIYIVFSAGYYGQWHGEPTIDHMQAYTVRVTELSANEGTSAGDGYLWPSGLTFRTEDTAKKLGFTNSNGVNYIDGQLYSEDGVDYLIIKEGGLTNQLLQTTDIDDPSAWTMVNDNMTFGYEAPCVVKFNGMYRLFGDGVPDTKPTGIRETTSDSLTKTTPWNEPAEPMFLDENDGKLVARHGTAIVLKAGTEEWQVAKSLLDAQGRHESGVMHRLYNSYSGEHFYTASGMESGGLTTVGWVYEGIGWVAPSTSDTPVYRLYNPYETLGDHHYTTDPVESASMEASGWRNEGVGWYSDDAKGTPLYRQYNPYAYSLGMTGAHNYTADEAEDERLAGLGWRSEGIAWYGLADRVAESASDATSEALQAASM